MARRELMADLSHLVLETFPRVMGYVGCSLRREAPVDQQQHFHVLRALREQDHSLSELAAVASVRLPTMSRTVDALSRRRWVERYHAEGDRRTLHVRITEEGRKSLTETENLAISRVSVLLEELEPNERQALGSALEQLSEIMQQKMEAMDEAT